MPVKMNDNSLRALSDVENGVGLAIRMLLDDIYVEATPVTPRKTGDLRHRVLRQMEGNFKGSITWATPYAAVQEQGYRTTKDGHRIYFRHYTTPGTGPKYAQNSVESRMANLPDYLDKVGLL